MPAFALTRPLLAAGFTLIELAVAMVVLALLLGGIAMPLAAQTDLRARRDTTRAMTDIRDALIGFAVVHGRLPCPAVATLDGGANGAGGEARAGSACACASTASDVATQGGTACADGNGQNTVSGVLPWAALGLPETDAWGYRYTYRIGTMFGRDPVQTEFGGTCSPSIAPARAGFALCTPSAITVKAETGGTRLVSDGVPAIVVSHGRNGLGAFTRDGNRIPLVGATTDENENANGDAIFVSNVTNDDLVVWLPAPILMERMLAAGLLP